MYGEFKNCYQIIPILHCSFTFAGHLMTLSVCPRVEIWCWPVMPTAILQGWWFGGGDPLVKRLTDWHTLRTTPVPTCVWRNRLDHQLE
jgi:hypothetical protein